MSVRTWKKVSVHLLICLTVMVSLAGAFFSQRATATDTVVDTVVPVDEVTVDPREAEEQQRELLAYQEKDAKIQAEYFHSEEDIQYYAYCDLKSADEELKPVILAARNRIIFRYSWVADGTSGQICGRDGEIKEELPCFSELFPENWDLPFFPPTPVDLTYYGLPNE